MRKDDFMFSSLITFIMANMLYLALHFENKNVFPKPLSPKEEQICFEQMKNGDEKARNKLIEHNLRLVAHVVKKYYSSSSSSDQDDLISIGTIGLIKAVNTFNFEKSSKFSTYAAKCVDNEILMHFRNLKKSACEVSIDEPIESDKNGNSVSLMDIVTDDSSLTDTVDLKLKCELLYKSIEKVLSEREKTIITLRYGLNKGRPLTQREVADLLRISRSYVSRIEKKALGKLREKMKDAI